MPKRQLINVQLQNQGSDSRCKKSTAGKVQDLRSRINKLATFKLLKIFCISLARQKKRLLLRWLAITSAKNSTLAAKVNITKLNELQSMKNYKNQNYLDKTVYNSSKVKCYNS